ncbi:hypothetical protein NEDG_02232 [Nematocida displodere]|uniref:Uncharacterized protein n=1 Tax=Nematocida displodere TaxID=1805483 RepID=A0A177EG73_9MICR|nr:hypothetical protein NEDG_02232 [Nematocida displodere]
MPQWKIYIRANYIIAAVLILGGIVVGLAYAWRSPNINQNSSTSQEKNTKEVEPSKPPKNYPIPFASQNNITPELTHDPISIQAATIAFFQNNGSGLLTAEHNHCMVIPTEQTTNVKIYMEKLKVEDIPEQIYSEIQFKDLSVFGSRFSSPTVFTPYTEVETLAKLLQALSGVYIAALSISAFVVNADLVFSPPNKVGLGITETLRIVSTGASFFEWFCKSVDLSTFTEGLVVEINDSDTTSIQCLDNLGIQRLSGLGLVNLPFLRTLVCQLTTSICSGDTGMLKLLNLPEHIHISQDLAMLLAEKRWADVEVDMHIWNKICFLAEKSMVVLGRLCVSVRDLRELDPGSVYSGVTDLTIQENTRTQIELTDFFTLAIKWVCSGKETQKINAIHILLNNPLLLNGGTNQTAEALGKFISSSNKRSAMFKQKHLFLNQRIVTIPERPPVRVGLNAVIKVRGVGRRMWTKAQEKFKQKLLRFEKTNFVE